MNMIRVNVDKKLLKKRKGNNNMINRTSLKIDMLKK